VKIVKILLDPQEGVLDDVIRYGFILDQGEHESADPSIVRVVYVEELHCTLACLSRCTTRPMG
jgi:hypothetical protein